MVRTYSVIPDRDGDKITGWNVLIDKDTTPRAKFILKKDAMNYAERIITTDQK